MNWEIDNNHLKYKKKLKTTNFNKIIIKNKKINKNKKYKINSKILIATKNKNKEKLNV